jgi:hypothetical protein
MMRHNPIEAAVLEQWGLQVISAEGAEPETALETFLERIAAMIEDEEDVRAKPQKVRRV